MSHLSFVPPPVVAVARQLEGIAIPWAIAGGWAIDLALGRETRSHADVDVAIYRPDQLLLRAARPEWRFDVMEAGKRVPWPAGAWLTLPVHELYAMPTGEGTPQIELLLNEREGGEWVYRRNALVRRALGHAIRRSPLGVPVLAPEIVLFYKSRTPRVHDEADFAAAFPHLGDEPRAWLRGALGATAPDHPWLALA